MIPQPEEIDTTNKRFAASSQQQHYNLMEVGNKGDCLVFDLFKNKIFKLEKDISKKEVKKKKKKKKCEQ